MKVLKRKKTKLTDGTILKSKLVVSEEMTFVGQPKQSVYWCHSIGNYNAMIYTLRKRGFLTEKQYNRLNELEKQAKEIVV